MSLAAVPSLDELAAQPERVRELPAYVAMDLLVRVVGLHGALLGQLFAKRANRPSQETTEETLLTVEEGARRLGTSVDWLYRNSMKLPFTVRVGRHLRFSRRGLDRWIHTRQGRVDR